MIVSTIRIGVGADIASVVGGMLGCARYGGGMGRRGRDKPNEISGDWPNLPVPDPIHEAVRRYVVNLRTAVGGDSIRAAATRTQVNYSTLHAILDGEAWPDAITVARTEHGLGRRLWDGPVALPEDGTGERGQDAG